MEGLGGVLVAPGDELPRQELGLVIQVAPGVEEGDLSLCGLGPGARQRCAGVVNVGPRPLDVGRLVQHRGVGALEVGLGLTDLRLEDVGIDAGDELVLLDPRVEIGEELPDLSGDLGPHLDGDDGVQVPGRRDRRGQRALFNFGDPVLRDRAPSLGIEPERRGSNHRGRDNQVREEPTPHRCSSLARLARATPF